MWLLHFLILTTCASAKVFNSQQLRHLNEATNSRHLSKRSYLESIVTHQSYAKVDPDLHYSSAEYRITTKQTGSLHETVRIQPIVDGIPVYGADRVFSLKEGTFVSGAIQSKRIQKRNFQDEEWKLNSQQALMAARKTSGYLKENKHTEFAVDSVEKVYFAVSNDLHHGSHLVPAWKLFDSSQMLKDRALKFIDAEDGRLLASHPLVCHDRGHVFTSNEYRPGRTPSIHEIPNLVSNNQNNQGKGMFGQVFRSFNSCKQYQCLQNLTGIIADNGTCDIDSTTCFDIDEDGLKEGQDYHTIQHWFSVNGKHINFDRDWDGDGYPSGRIIMVWEKAPTFGPRISLPSDGIWGSDVDFNKYSDKSNTDSFSELQAYYALSEHHKFMSSLLNVTSETGICLMGTGENCTQVDPITNISASKYTMPLRFVVNLPDMASPGENSAYPDIIQQIEMGRGKSSADPVVFPDSKGYRDAFFARGNFQPSQNETEMPVCENYKKGNSSTPSCLSIFDAPFTFIAFGQDERGGDWALNDCIVYHELTHAYVAKMVPGLARYIWDPVNGISSDPGAMNEAWSDYFASIHSGVQDFSKDTYNKHPFRSILNDNTCESNVGQIHYDGTIFSGGLWKVRQKISEIYGIDSTRQTQYDQVILQAMSMATTSETFEMQYRHILNILQDHPTLSKLHDFATSEFERRVFNCVRIFPFVETYSGSFTLPHALTTSANISVLPNQLSISPKPSDWAVTLSWSQAYLSPIIGKTTMGYAKTSLSALWSYGCPIQYQENIANDNSNAFTTPTGTQITAVHACNDELDSRHGASIDWKPVNFNVESMKGSIYFSFIPASVDKVFVMPGHQAPATLIMEGTQVRFHGMHELWTYTIAVYGLLNVLMYLIWAAHYCLHPEESTPKLSFTEKIRKLLTLNTFLQALAISLSIGATVSCILAISFAVARDIGLKVALGAIIAVGLIHLKLLLDMAGTKNSVWVAALQVLGSIGGLIAVFIPQTSLAVHLICFITFLIGFVGVVIAFAKKNLNF